MQPHAAAQHGFEAAAAALQELCGTCMGTREDVLHPKPGAWEGVGACPQLSLGVLSVWGLSFSLLWEQWAF